MFGPPGHAYVYLVYGIYHCLNVVTGEDGEAGAVLIRAVEPLTGVEAMRSSAIEARQRKQAKRLSAPGSPAWRLPDVRLGAGPGRLCASFGIDRSFSGTDLCAAGSPLRIESDSRREERPIGRSARIGVAYAGEPWSSVPWRLVLTASPSISGPESRRGAPD